MSVLWAKRGWMSGGTFVPHQLFTSGAQGAWYDPSDRSTLFQDAAGTTPVTAVEQPVRLMLDRSKGLVLGSELVTNGGFDSATGWTVPAGWAISGGQAVATATGGSLFGGSMTTVSGRWYQVEFDVVSYTSGNLLITIGANYSGNPTLTGAAMAPGRKSVLVLGGANTTRGVEFYGGSITATIDNISVRELPGNHALAPNDASRPVLRARYNLLTFSEQFDNAFWAKNVVTVTANAGVAPDGTTTADKLVGNAGLQALPNVSNIPTLIANTNYTGSVYAKASGYSFLFIVLRTLNSTTETAAYFDLSTGTVGTVDAGITATITALPDGWYRCTATKNSGTGANSPRLRFGVTNADNTPQPTNDGTSGILIWGAQLLTAADQASTGGAYQRIAAATDYDTSNPVWRPYLAFDGSDDSFSTSSIDFSGTDEMTVFAGVHKASDAARATLAELGNNVNSSFRLEAPNAATPTYQFASAGTNLVGTTTSSVYPAPTTNVLTGIGDISADVSTLRVNGAQASSNPADQGTGNYGNLSLFIGRRNNASQPFNGRLTSLIVLGRTATAAEISATEQWVAGKTGVTL